MATAMAFESFNDNGTVVIRNLNDMCISDNLDDLLEFLRFTGKGVMRMAFEVDEFAAPVLRKLPLTNLQELVETKTTNYGRYGIFYIPHRMFQVGAARDFRGTRYYGLKGFLNIPGILPTPPLDDVQQTGQEVLDAIDDIGLGGNNLKLTTAGAVFTSSEVGSKFMAGIPLDSDLPAGLVGDAVYLSSLADDKYWVSAHQLGRFKEGESFDYDLTMAFGSICSKLFDIRDLTFWRSAELGKREQGALYGVIPGKFYIDPDAEYSHASPIVAELPNELTGNPVGWLPEDVYALEEIRTVERYDLGFFQQTGEGIFAGTLTAVRPRFPYQNMMNWLYEKRQWSDMASTVAKVAANAVIGKMTEKTEGAKFLNHWYHAQITATTRCLITKFLVENDVKASEMLAVQTDGVRLNRNILLENGRMGQWRNNGSYPTIIHSSHRIYVGDKRPYHITYDDVVRMIDEHPNTERYSKQADHRITLREAVEGGDIGRVGEVVELPVLFDLIRMENQQNRQFDKFPATGRQLLENKYTSHPIIF